MNTNDVLCCPACGVVLAEIKAGRLVQIAGPLYDDGDCLEWLAEVVALPSPPLYVSEQYLSGHCGRCDHALCWLLVEFARLPWPISREEASERIGGIEWHASDYRVEEFDDDQPWRWVTADLSIEYLRGRRHWVGPFSVAAMAICDPEGYGLYRLFRNILLQYWDRMLLNASQQLLMTGSNQND